jgi:hypothetical protein
VQLWRYLAFGVWLDAAEALRAIEIVSRRHELRAVEDDPLVAGLPRRFEETTTMPPPMPLRRFDGLTHIRLISAVSERIRRIAAVPTASPSTNATSKRPSGGWNFSIVEMSLCTALPRKPKSVTPFQLVVAPQEVVEPQPPHVVDVGGQIRLPDLDHSDRR